MKDVKPSVPQTKEPETQSNEAAPSSAPPASAPPIEGSSQEDAGMSTTTTKTETTTMPPPKVPAPPEMTGKSHDQVDATSTTANSEPPKVSAPSTADVGNVAPTDVLKAMKDAALMQSQTGYFYYSLEKAQTPIQGPKYLFFERTEFQSIYGFACTESAIAFIEARPQHDMVFPSFHDMLTFRLAFSQQLYVMFVGYGGILCKIEDSHPMEEAAFYYQNSPTQSKTWGNDLQAIYLNCCQKREHPLYKNKPIRDLLRTILTQLPSAQNTIESDLTRKNVVAVVAQWEFELTTGLDALMRKYLLVPDPSTVTNLAVFLPNQQGRFRNTAYDKFVSYINVISANWTAKTANDYSFGGAYNPGTYAIPFTPMSNNHIIMLDSSIMFRLQFWNIYYPMIRTWCEIKDNPTQSSITQNTIISQLRPSTTRADSAMSITALLQAKPDLDTICGKILACAVFSRWFKLYVHEPSAPSVRDILNATVMPLILPKQVVSQSNLYWRNSYLLCNYLYVFRDYTRPILNNRIWTMAYWLEEKDNFLGTDPNYDPLYACISLFKTDMQGPIAEYFCYGAARDGSGCSSGGTTVYNATIYDNHRMFTSSPGYEPLYNGAYLDMSVRPVTEQQQRLVNFCNAALTVKLTQNSYGNMSSDVWRAITITLREVGQNSYLVNFYKMMESRYRSLCALPMAFPMSASEVVNDQLKSKDYLSDMIEKVIVPLSRENIAKTFKLNTDRKNNFPVHIPFKSDSLFNVCVANFQETLITALPMGIVDSMWHMNHGFFVLGGHYIRYLIGLFGMNPLLPANQSTMGNNLNNSTAMRCALNDLKADSKFNDFYNLVQPALRYETDKWYPPLDGMNFWMDVYTLIESKLVENAAAFFLNSGVIVGRPKHNMFHGSYYANPWYSYTNLADNVPIDATFVVEDFNQGPTSYETSQTWSNFSQSNTNAKLLFPIRYEVEDNGTDMNGVRVVKGVVPDISKETFPFDVDTGTNAPYKVGTMKLFKTYQDPYMPPLANTNIYFRFWQAEDNTVGYLEDVISSFVSSTTAYDKFNFYKPDISLKITYNTDIPLVGQ